MRKVRLKRMDNGDALTEAFAIGVYRLWRWATSRRRPARARQPNRRPHETARVEAAGVAAHISFPPDRREVFFAGPKPGSALAVILNDVGVIISVALQHGVPVEAFARSVGREPAAIVKPEDLVDPHLKVKTKPASVIGAALDLLAGEGR